MVHVARMGEKRNAYSILVGQPEGMRLLGRPRRGWVDNIKMNLRKIGWDGVDWIDMAQDRDQSRPLVNTVLKLRVGTQDVGGLTELRWPSGSVIIQVMFCQLAGGACAPITESNYSLQN
jgi:hypothetical protein